MPNATITRLFVYPVKSCAGITLKESLCTDAGLVNDRQWVVVSNGNTVLTQRDCGRMALIRPQVKPDGIILEAPGQAPLAVTNCNKAESSVSLEVWGNACAGFDQGTEAAGWLSAFLDRPCRLVRFDDSFTRNTKQKKPDGVAARIAFADASPLLVISEESLDDLNSRLPERIPMDRFRPSVVIRGLGEFSEDRAKCLRIGEMTLYPAKPCARCVLTTIDQETGIARGTEPLRTLNTYRREGDKVLFGQYFMPDKSGTLHVGDPIDA